MRIIAGEARGRKLATPPGFNTRPSSDRLKEALFGSIQFDLQGAIVLDLFSGSGALGLEAVSRGAALAYCNDSDADSVRAIVENIQQLSFGDKVQVSQKKFSVALKDAASKKLQFDFIFLDPPYGKGLAEAALKSIAEMNLLAADGRIFWENEGESKIADMEIEGIGYRIRSKRRYGKAVLVVLDQVNAKKETEGSV